MILEVFYEKNMVGFDNREKIRKGKTYMHGVPVVRRSNPDEVSINFKINLIAIKWGYEKRMKIATTITRKRRKYIQ